MIKVDQVREQPVVMSGKFEPVSERYGYKVATAQQLQVVRAFVEDLVKLCETRIDKHFTDLKDIGENPYRPLIRPEQYANYVSHVTRVELMTKDEYDELFARAFGLKKGEKSDVDPEDDGTDKRSGPDPDKILCTALEDVKNLYTSHGGYQVYGPYTPCRTKGMVYGDGEAFFFLMRDPIYVEAQDAHAAIVEKNLRGAARDRTWFMRLLLKLGKQPFKPLPLPLPGPPAVTALSAPAATPALPALPTPTAATAATAAAATTTVPIAASASPAASAIALDSAPVGITVAPSAQAAAEVPAPIAIAGSNGPFALPR